jgi:hypothetical protein
MSDSLNDKFHLHEPEYDYDDEPLDGDEDFDEEEFFDCGAMRDMNHRLVGCGKAGSEECDFECPYRESVERSLRAQAGWETRKKRPARRRRDARERN